MKCHLKAHALPTLVFKIAAECTFKIGTCQTSVQSSLPQGISPVFLNDRNSIAGGLKAFFQLADDFLVIPETGKLSLARISTRLMTLRIYANAHLVVWMLRIIEFPRMLKFFLYFASE